MGLAINVYANCSRMKTNGFQSKKGNIHVEPGRPVAVKHDLNWSCKLNTVSCSLL